MDISTDLIEQIEYHANMLAKLGKQAGFDNITDKTKWREVIMAGKLGHTAFKKMSSGKKSDNYGSDAFDPISNKKAEYKSKAIKKTQLNNLLQKIKSNRKNTRYKPLSVSGVYNGAYNHESVDRYSKHDHYFGIFYDELCLMIIKIQNDYVIETLRKGVDKMLKKKGKTTNGNSVAVNLRDTHLYQIVYCNKEWFEEHGKESSIIQFII